MMGILDSFGMRLVDVCYFVSLASIFQSCRWHVFLVSMGELLIAPNTRICVGAGSERVLCGVQEGVYWLFIIRGVWGMARDGA